MVILMFSSAAHEVILYAVEVLLHHILVIMSRTYRPRLSKDRAIAQRVGEALERERLHEFSVARQIAALKVLEESEDASKGSASKTKPVRAKSPTTAMTSCKRKYAAASGSRQSQGDGRSDSVADEAENHPSPAPTLPQKVQRTAETGDRWACLSCSLLNSAKAVKCKLCGTKHFKQPIQQSSQQLFENSTLDEAGVVAVKGELHL